MATEVEVMEAQKDAANVQYDYWNTRRKAAIAEYAYWIKMKELLENVR